VYGIEIHFYISQKFINVKFKVLLENRAVAGYYMIASEHDGDANKVMHVLNIAVGANFRRKKFGTTMLLDILGR
jgi:ribosomal-protein-alanine N-acetyltransferase